MACTGTSILIAERAKHENSTRDDRLRIGLDLGERLAIAHRGRRFVATAVDRRQIPLERPSSDVRLRESRRRLFFARRQNDHLSGRAAGVHVLSDLHATASAGKAQLVSTGRGRTTCSYFAPDGKSIIFASSHLDPDLSKTEEAARKQQEEDANNVHRRYQWDFDPEMEIFAADLDGNHLRRLTDSPGYDAEGAYTPDGKHIVFCSDRGGNPNLYVMDADGSHVRQLTNATGYNGGPFTSPDGRWVVFRSDRKKEGFLQIHVIGFDGQNDTALTDNVGVNWAPYWHPTQPYIIWTGADHSDPHATPNYDLWLMKYDERDGKIVPAKTGESPIIPLPTCCRFSRPTANS